MKYRVSTRETWAQDYVVEANSREEAIKAVELAIQDGSEEPRGDPELVETQPSDTWYVSTDEPPPQA